MCSAIWAEFSLWGGHVKTKEQYLAEFKKWGLIGGRPRAFKSPREMAERLAEFLVETEGRIVEKLTKDGKIAELHEPGPILIECFCDFCGISKTTFYNYADKPEFRPLIDNIRGKVEKYLAVQCVEGKAGNKADFILKNMFGNNWKDKNISEFDISNDLKKALVGFVDSPTEVYTPKDDVTSS